MVGRVKKFLTYNEQIELLESKGLIINDKNAAIKLLKEHSYFDLINGYKYPFKQNGRSGGNYKANVTISDIYHLYCFDKTIRYALVQRLMQVEIHIKSLLSYAFCEQFGENEQAYQDANNYDYVSKDKQKDINKLISKIVDLLNKADEFPYMKHQKAVYGNIPLWVLSKALTFGNISKMYSFQRPNIQTKISKEFDCVSEGALASFLDVLTRFRNVCAHNERLFDFKYNKRSISNTDLHVALNVPKNKNFYSKGKSDFFAVMIALKYLLDDNSFITLVDEINDAINQLLDNTRQIQRQQLYSYMGLTDDWQRIRDIDVKNIVIKRMINN